MKKNNKYKELPIEFWEKERPKANKYQQALDALASYYDYDDYPEILQELIMKQSVFQELYDEYVINEKGDTLTEGAKQLAYALEIIYESMELVIDINRLENE